MYLANRNLRSSLVALTVTGLLLTMAPSARSNPLDDALEIGVTVGVLGLLAKKKLVTPMPSPKKTVVKKTKVQKPTKTFAVKVPVGPVETRFRGKEVLFILKPNAPDTALPALIQSLKLRRIDESNIVLLHRTVQRYALTDGRTVAAAVAALAANPQVEQTEPNYVYELADTSSAILPSGQYALAELHIPEAQTLATGAKVVVALIDSRADSNHPALAGRIKSVFSAVDTPSEGPDSHGTAMAGAIVAKGKVLGVAPDVELLAAECFSKDKAQHMNGVTFNILKCVDWSAGQSATIQNLSFAGPQDPMLSREMGEAVALGGSFIAAAGNAGPKSPPLFPAADENAIAVTALDKDEGVYRNAVHGKHIAVAAPGVDVLVLAPGNAAGLSTGTSVAAAEISGLAALATEVTGKLNLQQLRNLLAKSAQKLNLPADAVGAGLADAVELVNQAKKLKSP